MEAEPAEPLWCGLKKQELLRVVMQLLLDMGYSETVATLEKESNCRYQSESISELERVIKDGDMKAARSHLSKLKLSSDIRMACAFLCSQQSFATALYHKDMDKALQILRDDLSPSAFDEDTRRRVKLCASLLVYPKTEQKLKTELLWEAESSLSNLWLYIQQLISPELCVPPGRLVTLIKQALEHQELYCQNHRTSKTKSALPSLYQNHSCKDVGIPTSCIARLDGHVDEIWDIAFSPDERFIATAGMDKCVLLWNAAQPFDILHTWEEHINMVISVSWSYDSVLLASLSSAGDILIFSPGSQASLLKISNNSGPHNYLQWIPGRRSLLTGGDTKMTLYGLSTVNGSKDPRMNKKVLDDRKASNASSGPIYIASVLKKWNIETRIRSLIVNHDGRYAYFSTPDYRLHVLNLRTLREEYPLQENATITMLTASSLYNQVLVSMSGVNPVLRLWDMDERRLIQTYHGHREERYVLKPTMGGPDECYIVSGSEDTQIYIWSKLFGTLLSVIPAHSSTVNAVAWSRSPDAFLYSASDDGQVAVWATSRNDTAEREMT